LRANSAPARTSAADGNVGVGLLCVTNTQPLQLRSAPDFQKVVTWKRPFRRMAVACGLIRRQDPCRFTNLNAIVVNYDDRLPSSQLKMTSHSAQNDPQHLVVRRPVKTAKKQRGP
jgi:hypothetical protein